MVRYPGSDPEAVTQPEPQASHRFWPRTWRQWSLGGLAVVLLLAAAVYFGYVRPALAAADGYKQRLGSSSLRYFGDLEFYGQDFLSALDSKISFTGAYQRQPLAASLNFSGTWATRPMTGQTMVDHNRLYLKLGGSQLPVIRYKQSNFLLPLKPQWYSAKFDESLFDNICQNTTPPSPGGQLELYRQIKSLRFNDSWWVNLWDPRGTHFQGSLPSSQLAALLTALQNAMPAGCDLNTLGFSASDAKSIKTTYDLWAKPGDDRVQLVLEDKVLGSRLLFSLETTDYGQAVKITTPASSVDVNQIYAGVKPTYFEYAP